MIAFPGTGREPNISAKKPTLKDVNDMLVELNIKLNARLRSDGRFELRPYVNGKRIYIYGRTPEDLLKN